MSAMIAYCGIRCTECDTYDATVNDDNVKRKEIADQWSKQFNAQFRPEQMNCVGCKAESGPIFFYCNMCQIRQCCQQKRVITCAHCDDYGCDTLEQFLAMSPENRQILDNLRESI